MAVTLEQLEAAMVHSFLANAAVSQKIGRRFYKIASAEWILARDSVSQEQSPRMGQWADYRRSGQVVQRLLGLKESNSFAAGYEIRTWGQVMEEAEALQTLFIAVIGQGYSGDWGPSTSPVAVKNVVWDYSAQTSDYDEGFEQAFTSIGLVVKYRPR